MPDVAYPILDPRLPAPHIVPGSLPVHAQEPDSYDAPDTPDTLDALEPLDDDTFPWDAFPEPVRAWLRHIAGTTGTGPDPVAIPFLALAGATIGAIHALRLAPGWIERPTLWVALVGEVGVGKTPAIAAVRRPLDLLQERIHGDHLVTGTVAIEPLFTELYDSYGLAIVRDELIGLAYAMEGARGRRGDARQAFLSLWSASPFHSARPGPDPLILSMPVVGILGGIQPRVFARLRYRDGDGFLERVLPVTLPGTSRYWREPCPPGEAVPDAPPETAIRDVFPGPDGEGWTIDRDPAARAVWAAWYNDNVDRLRAAPDNALAVGFYRKLPAHAARIALVLHVLHHPADAHRHPLNGDTMAHAAALAERLRIHIHRVIPHLGAGPAKVIPRPKPTLEQRAHRLLTETDAPDGWLDRTAIWERLRRPDRDELSAALEGLVAGRIAEARTITRPGARKPARQWRLAAAHR